MNSQDRTHSPRAHSDGISTRKKTVIGAHRPAVPQETGYGGEQGQVSHEQKSQQVSAGQVDTRKKVDADVQPAYAHAEQAEAEQVTVDEGPPGAARAPEMEQERQRDERDDADFVRRERECSCAAGAQAE